MPNQPKGNRKNRKTKWKIRVVAKFKSTAHFPGQVLAGDGMQEQQSPRLQFMPLGMDLQAAMYIAAQQQQQQLPGQQPFWPSSATNPTSPQFFVEKLETLVEAEKQLLSRLKDLVVNDERGGSQANLAFVSQQMAVIHEQKSRAFLALQYVLINNEAC